VRALGALAPRDPYDLTARATGRLQYDGYEVKFL